MLFFVSMKFTRTSCKASSGRAPITLRTTGRRQAAWERIVRLFPRNAEHKEKTMQAARATPRAAARALRAPRPWSYPCGKKCRGSESGYLSAMAGAITAKCALALSHPRAWSRSSACGTPGWLQSPSCDGCVPRAQLRGRTVSFSMPEGCSPAPEPLRISRAP